MRRVRTRSRQYGCLSALGVWATLAVLPDTASAFVNSSNVFISELHYDNVGTDADEFVEVSGPAGTNLSGYTLLLYNGNGGASYTPTLNLSGTLSNQGGTGYGALAFDAVGLQNGAPDGIALLGPGGVLIEFLSYEGVFTATNGFASGVGSTDIGVAEEPAPALGQTLARTGNGNLNLDLTWTGPAPGTKGALNFSPGGTGPTARTIPEIQGSAAASPIVGNVVRTTGVVSAVFPGLNGFYLQDTAGDGNAATSDGILVLSSTPVSLGSQVQVDGTVLEQDGVETALQASLVSNLAAGPFAVPNTVVPLPSSTLERFEGMKVQIATANANRMRVAQTFFLGRYGQLTLSSPDALGATGPLITPTQLFDPSPLAGSPAQQLQQRQQEQILVLDDGSDLNPNGDNPNLVPYLGCQDAPALPPIRVLRSGDFASNLSGILDQGLITTSASPVYHYRLHPLDLNSITFTPGNPRPSAAPNPGASYEVVSFNVENYFTTLRQNDANARGAFDGPELARQTDKLVHALVKLNADIVGLAELQNNAAALAMLVDGGISDSTASDPAVAVTGLNDVLGAGTYAVLPAPAVVGTDQIKVGFIYKPATTTPVGTAQVIPASVAGQNTYLTFNRPSLAQTFQQNATGQKFTVVMNHWKSKGSDCDANIIPPADVDLEDLAGNCNLTRRAMAQAMVQWLASDPTASGDPDFLVLGDLNSYAKEDPIDVMLAAGYVNLIQRDEGTEAQSFVFDGRGGYLDYGLASPSLAPQVVHAESWAINSDEPKVMDYENFFNQVGCYQGTNEFRAADHDPLSLSLALGAPKSVPLLGVRSGLVTAAGLVGVAAVSVLKRRRQRPARS